VPPSLIGAVDIHKYSQANSGAMSTKVSINGIELNERQQEQQEETNVASGRTMYNIKD